MTGALGQENMLVSQERKEKKTSADSKDTGRNVL